MSNPVCAVIGVGPGNGTAIARKFSSEGYKIALLSRNEDYLNGLAHELGDTRGYAYDALDTTAPEKVFREPRTILAFGRGCSARAEVSPRSGTVLTPGRRPRGPLHDATRTPPVSALKRVQLLFARAEPAGGCCSRGSSCRS